MAQATTGEEPGPAPLRSAALTPTHDCDVCVIGDDVAALVIACDLAALGKEVVLFASSEPGPTLGLDGTLAPGFSLPMPELIARVGAGNAAELFQLSHAAAQRGEELVVGSGSGLGPQGRLKVARPRWVAALTAEHEALERIAPSSSVLLGADDTAALLATSAFGAALGVVPAHRVDAAALRTALQAAARAGGIRVMGPEPALSADVHGLRKYVSTPKLKVRAYHVVFSGGAGLARLAPELRPSLLLRPWVGGRFRLAGADVPYGGLVEEMGSTGLRWHWDGPLLSVAAETASRIRGQAARARVLQRHAGAAAPGLGFSNAEAADGASLALPRRLMPLIQEGEKGVWYCATPGSFELTHGLLGAELIVPAIAGKDDRIRLLQPFGLEPSGTRAVSGWRAGAIYWGERLADRLWTEPPSAGQPGPVSSSWMHKLKRAVAPLVSWALARARKSLRD